MAILTIDDIRAEGITEEIASDDQVEDAIAFCTELFSEQTGQFFEPLAGELDIDGDNTDSIFLSIPIIEVTSITDNVTGNVMSPTNYRAYTGRTRLQNDRRNPKIFAKNGYGFSYGPGRWTIAGTFGYTEADNSTPVAVKRAILILTIEMLLHPIVSPSEMLPELGVEIVDSTIVEEVTDDHKIKWSPASSPWDPLDAISNSPFVRKAIRDYRKPFGISTQVQGSRFEVPVKIGFPFTE